MGVHGFFLCGSFGQGPAMRISQRKRVADLVVEEVGDRVPVVVHVGATEPYTGINLGLHARSIGATAISMVGPYYYSDRSAEEIILHYQMVDDAVELPMLVYNVPAYQGYDMSTKFMRKLARAVPRIFGASIASSETRGTLNQAWPYIEAVPEWAIFGSAFIIMPGMLQGLRGSISPAIALAPELGVALIAAIDEGRHDEATWLQTLATELSQTLARFMASYGRAPCLEGLRALGFPVKQYPRWPTGLMPERERAYFLDLLKRVRGATTWMLHPRS